MSSIREMFEKVRRAVVRRGARRATRRRYRFKRLS